VAYAEGVVRAYNIQTFAVLYTLQSEWNFFSHCVQVRELYFVVVVSLLTTESSLGSLLLGSWSIFCILLSLVIYICMHIYIYIYIYIVSERERERKLSGISCCI
jgi:hypothetical protein